jgi:hypothetical protein
MPFKPKLGVKLAPPELADIPKSSEIGASSLSKLKAAPVAMFGGPAQAVFAPPKIKKAKVAGLKQAADEPLPKEAPVKEAAVNSSASIVDEAVVNAPDAEIMNDDLKEMKMLIMEEETADPYDNPVPSKYIPESRQGFSDFIKQTYVSFTLDPTAPLPSGEKYPYQRFIREYMRNESPYRGILTYHGLGSGKTCTAIAAAEALYSTANKKIIVMAPASLKKNFLKEVSLCGFRHFRLKNFWVSMPVSDEDARLFATSVLGVSESHLRTATAIWIPDFRKTPEEANYDSLSADEQTEIRKQIISILLWDEKKNPTGRIRFISYNGITSKRLKEMACVEGGATFFNDAVIIVDEIHNLVRLMQGTIDPYLLGLPGARRIIAKEDVTVTPWKPSLCNNAGKNYMRGYLFYRLLLDAKNSKIIGLSGTPIINFPEEVGILMNILHGYISTLDFLVQEVGDDAQKRLKDILLSNIYTDYVGVNNDSSGRGSKATVTFLPYGVRKIKDSIGVERIPQDTKIPNIDEIKDEIEKTLVAAKFTISKTDMRALPLLPPFGEAFRDKFISGEGLNVNSKIVLVKRLTGLISYYKGSRADLMPSVKVDSVVRVPMSAFSQKGYVAERTIEVMSEKKKKSGAGELTGAWAEVYEVGTGSQTSNYKMASRQACNFIFPSDVIRPKPKTKQEALQEADTGNKLGDIIDTVQEPSEEKFPELDEEENEVIGLADEEDAAIRSEITEGPVIQDAGGKEDDEDIDKAPEEAYEEATSTTLTNPVASKFKFNPSVLKAKMEEQTAKQKADCKSGTAATYKEATVQAKECLQTLAKYSLKLGGENGLETHSPKYASMLEHIKDVPGSSLVYSQFLDMEGIGIFRLAMHANGYAPIEIVQGPSGPVFTKATLESLGKGPGGQLRYMTFSGGEMDDIRRMYLDIFNANFNQLPQHLKEVLDTNKFVNNHKGEIAKVFCITSAGAEGLSLKCVRAVHIMEPYWNDVRLKQVKGRAIRIGSHLELPPKDRNVSIYTYVTSFPPDTQTLKVGDRRIDETIRQADAVDRETAVKLKLPITEGASQYVMTTDERIYVIAEKKKAITNALEAVMKSAAVDCQLNIKENKDGTFTCLDLKGAVGDFLYHPDLDIDIRESASKYQIVPKADVAPSVASLPSEPSVKPVYIKKSLKGIVYLLKEIKDESGITIGFEMYAESDTSLTTLVGTAGAKDGKPAPPVKMV